jgi:hypothetical protein
MSGMRPGSWIAFGLLAFYATIVASGLWLEQTDWPYGPLHAILEIVGGVLSFPLVLLVLLLDPQYEAGLVMFIVAAVANCYLWGYCIEWIIRRTRRC